MHAKHPGTCQAPGCFSSGTNCREGRTGHLDGVATGEESGSLREGSTGIFILVEQFDPEID